MGVPCSCLVTVQCDLENAFESVIAKSIKLQDDDLESPLKPIGFDDKDSEEAIKLTSRKSQNMSSPRSPVFDLSSPKHEAAVKLQKVYKSFRTRRKLADCAVLIEQSWWKLLDFAELKHSSISFFDLDKHETAISRWSRARTRAAKVGKGLSKNCKAQKLALQHWLEAIDPRHRYGHNLHFYYVNWLNSQSKEPFFYWLDIGEGKEVNLIEKCPRSKLQQQCIKYLGPMERQAYEVAVENGKLFYKQSGEVIDTTKEPKGFKWIFVLSTSKTLYVGQKKKGSFQHSSFLAGGAALAAGRIVAEKGVLKAVWPHSGHYRPTPENFQDFISFLQENNVDLTDVKLDPIDEEEEEVSVGKKCTVYLRSNSSEEDLARKDRSETDENENKTISNDINSRKEETTATIQTPKSKIAHHGFDQKLTALEIPSKDNVLQKLMNENQVTDESAIVDSPLGSLVEEHHETKDEITQEESILQNADKKTKSFQLGKHLSREWSTGAGFHIRCLRDSPSGLQLRALNQVNISPSKQHFGLDYPFRASTPICSNLWHRNSNHSKMQFSPVKILTASSF